MDDKPDPAYGDMHLILGYKCGENDVSELGPFLEELFHIGYLKADRSKRLPVSFELKPVGDELPESMMANRKRKLVEAWLLASLPAE